MLFFRRNQVDINSITFPTFGWNKVQETAEIKQWMNPEQTLSLSVNFFKIKPDLPTVQDIQFLRKFYRDQLIAANGGLIQVDLIQLDDYKVVQTIFKIKQEPTGMTYLASLTIPFKNYSYVIKITAPELGMTGMRDTVISARWFEDPNNDNQSWMADPYDPMVSEGVPMNKSEEEQYDAQFPNHPLSQARKLLKAIEAEVVFSQKFQKVKKFKK